MNATYLLFFFSSSFLAVFAQNCPNGFTINGDKCFKVYTMTKAWSDAMNTCNGVSQGTLAKMENEDDKTTLESLTQNIQVHGTLTLSTENNYHYHYMSDQGLSITGKTSITFEVMACNDAHIALSEIKGDDTQKTYEIVIGGWADSQSVIRTYKQGPHMDTAAHQNHPVDCHKYMPFWISWANGVIAVGKGNTVGQNTFMSWKDPNPHPVNYVAFSTGFGSSGKWKFPLGTNVPAKFWLGGKFTSTSWKWAPDMSEFDYTNWAPSQPDASQTKTCLLMDGGHGVKWSSQECNVLEYFVCQTSASNIIGR